MTINLADAARAGEGEVQCVGADGGAAAVRDSCDGTLPAAAARGAIHATAFRSRSAVLPHAGQGKN